VRVLRAHSRPAGVAEQVELPWLLRSRRVDVFHATTFCAPFVGGGRYVLTLHDMIYLDLPGLYGRHLDRYFRTATRAFAAKAAAVVTVSEFSRAQIERHFHIPSERIEVVPCGIDSRFHPASEGEVAAVRARLGLPRDFLLYVGGFVAHKNVPSLLRAYARIKDGAPPLLLCGRHSETIQPEIDRLALRSHVRTIPGQGHDTLPALYTAARAFVFPSRYEGFGLPPMEALACGTPTVVSDAGSLPEVTGGAALTYPVDDEAALAERLREILSLSAERRAGLTMAGRVQAAQFTWERTARRMAALYRRLT